MAYDPSLGYDPSLMNPSTGGTINPDFWSQFQTGAVYQPQGSVVGTSAPLPSPSTPATTAPTATPAPTSSTSTTPTDMRSALSQIYQQYGLDPNNPGPGLANVDYFIQQSTSKGPTDYAYWTNRLAQEIQNWKSGGSLGGGSMGGGFSGGVTPGAGYLGQIYGGQYQLPTAEQAQNLPGLQFAINQGLQGIERGAAAKGTLLTGGTQKALANYATNAALSQGYLPLAQLGLNAFNTNYNVFRNNQNDLFNRYYNLADLGYRASA